MYVIATFVSIFNCNKSTFPLMTRDRLLLEKQIHMDAAIS
jgi:hypothetical protein